MSFASTIETIKVWKNYFFGSLERFKSCVDINGKEIHITFGNTEEKVNAGLITKIIRFEKYEVGREYKVYSGSIGKGTAGYWNFPIKIIERNRITYNDLTLELVNQALGLTDNEKTFLNTNWNITPDIIVSCFIKFTIKTDYYYLKDNSIDPTIPYIDIYVHTIEKVDKLVKSKKQKKLFPEAPEPIAIDEGIVISELIKLSSLTPRIPTKSIESHFRTKFRYSTHITLTIINKYTKNGLLIKENDHYKLVISKVNEYIKKKGITLPEEPKARERKKS